MKHEIRNHSEDERYQDWKQWKIKEQKTLERGMTAILILALTLMAGCVILTIKQNVERNNQQESNKDTIQLLHKTHK